jgi:demethylmenaquinone methyltransferase/2-methoxy-6-polyprenyl-1,4-benzoquinol methylase
MPIATDDARALSAAQGGAGKRSYVRQIFSEIAPRYDLLNHLLSMNVDRVWRRRAIAALRIGAAPRGTFLDLCAGTLDVSVAITSWTTFQGSVVAADFAEPMLRAGRSKSVGRRIDPVAGDALDLPFAAGSFAGAIVAFGIRNVADLDLALAEVYRVLAPGARFVILEFSTPRNSVIRAAYHLYSGSILPLIGRLVSGHRTAYRYLPRSIASFPVEEELSRRLSAVGFVNVGWESLTFGVAAIHAAERPRPAHLAAA